MYKIKKFLKSIKTFMLKLFNKDNRKSFKNKIWIGVDSYCQKSNK